MLFLSKLFCYNVDVGKNPLSGRATVCVESAVLPVSAAGFLRGLRLPSSPHRCACEGHQGVRVAPVGVGARGCMPCNSRTTSPRRVLSPSLSCWDRLWPPVTLDQNKWIRISFLLFKINL